jgi:hypothetical protein
MTPLLPLLLLCLLVPLPTTATASLPADFYRLLAAKVALSDPTSSLVAWDASLSPCRWPHVLCSSSSSDNPSVASLLLSNLSLAGEFSDQLCLLTSLFSLDLSYNSIIGLLPPALPRCLR